MRKLTPYFLILAILVSACGNARETNPVITPTQTPVPTQTPHIIYIEITPAPSPTTPTPTQTSIPTLETVTPTITPENTVIPWQYLGTEECNFPIWSYLNTIGKTGSAALQVSKKDNSCQLWYEVYKPDRDNFNLFARVVDDHWVAATTDIYPELQVFDHSKIELEAEDGWAIYDLKTQILHTITIGQSGNPITSESPKDIGDIIIKIGLDNACNWPHSQQLVAAAIQASPEADEYWSFGWQELTGCDGFNQVLVQTGLQDEVFLTIANGEEITTHSLTGLNDPYLHPANDQGSEFFTLMGDWVTIDDSGITISSANKDLLHALQEMTYDYRGFEVGTLYQLARGTTLETASEPIATKGQPVDDIYVYTIQYRHEGKWYTAVFIWTDNGYRGPFFVNNIREFVSWEYADNKLVGTYNDNTEVSFTINP